MDKNEMRTKCFSALIALLPLLSNYRSPISSVDLGTFLILVFSIFSLSYIWYCSDFMPLYVYILLLTPMTVLFFAENNVAIVTILLRYAKFIIVLGFVFGFGFYEKYYDEQMAFKVMRVVVYTCAAFIILQRVFYLVGIVISAPFIQFATNDAYTEGYSMESAGLFRPSAFFLEPAHLAVYCLVYLVYLLFKKDDLQNSLIVLITVLCSGSGIGLVFSIMTYCVYFLLRFRQNTEKVLVAMASGVVVLLGMSRMTFFQQVVNRFTTDNLEGGGNAIQVRIGTGYQLFLEKDWLLQVFGSGYGNVPVDVYLNGMTYILNTLGLVGCGLFLWLIIRYMHKGQTWQKIGLLIVLGLLFGSQIFTPASLALYFCVYNNKSPKDKQKQIGA